MCLISSQDTTRSQSPKSNNFTFGLIANRVEKLFKDKFCDYFDSSSTKQRRRQCIEVQLLTMMAAAAALERTGEGRWAGVSNLKVCFFITLSVSHLLN